MIITLLATLAVLGPSSETCPPAVCSCVSLGPVSEARARGETIFEGRVLQMRDSTIWRAEGPRLKHVSRKWRAVTLEVRRVWNGAPGDTVRVLTGTGGGDCGYPFEEGEEYVVFADRFDGFLVSSICSHTTDVKQAGAIRDSLGTPLDERAAGDE
jgi:hypothetical protein